jgi:hypothetical protein
MGVTLLLKQGCHGSLITRAGLHWELFCLGSTEVTGVRLSPDIYFEWSWVPMKVMLLLDQGCHGSYVVTGAGLHWEFCYNWIRVTTGVMILLEQGCHGSYVVTWAGLPPEL